ncbi:site-specific integrase [Mucilaginibacter limnophilus]|uniref:Site-specific integrase n=1 Tax=Mucilaginibacter limnophilus TaxID=1932778 RepID=A0A437MQ53_9SPHI|nr:site-specific integrase [Mucilaginibacter limnophilus]RVT99770.1 site-specific integrase [Mucilaginibacter limnophilus]
MKNHQNLNLLFWHRKSKADKNGYAPVICRISIDGELEEEISIGKKVHINEWCRENKKALGDTIAARETNLKIIELSVDLNRYFIVLQTQYERITPLMLKNLYCGKEVGQRKQQKKRHVGKRKEPLPTLLQATDIHIANFAKMVEKGLRSAETLKQWRATRKKLVNFLQFQYRATDLELEEIEFVFAKQFYHYLTVENDKVIGEAAAKKQIKNTKEILTFAETSNWIHKNPIQRFKCGGDETEIPPLEMYEVNKIWRKDLPIQRLSEVRDAFIFQCFTGFAFQDVYAISTENIIPVGISGERWLIKDRGKTNVAEMVPIMPIIDVILKRYEDHPCRTKKGLLIPVNSNARYNGYLKELAVICGIRRELNTHLARHTFADIMLNEMGFSLAEVSKMLGHKSIRTTQRYTRVRRQLISKTYSLVKHTLFTEDGELRQVAL